MIVVKNKAVLNEFSLTMTPISWGDFIKSICRRNGNNMIINIFPFRMSSVITINEMVKVKLSGSNLSLCCRNTIITLGQNDIISVSTNESLASSTGVSYLLNLKNSTSIAITS